MDLQRAPKQSHRIDHALLQAVCTRPAHIGLGFDVIDETSRIVPKRIVKLRDIGRLVRVEVDQFAIRTDDLTFVVLQKLLKRPVHRLGGAQTKRTQCDGLSFGEGRRCERVQSRRLERALAESAYSRVGRFHDFFSAWIRRALLVQRIVVTSRSSADWSD